MSARGKLQVVGLLDDTVAADIIGQIGAVVACDASDLPAFGTMIYQPVAVVPEAEFDALRDENTALRTALREAVDHLETVLGTDSDMPSFDATWDAAEVFVEGYRAKEKAQS